MKSLQQYITEKLKVSKSKKSVIKVSSKDDLKKLINDKYNDNQIRIDLTDVDVSGIKDMSELFKNCAYETIDITGWDTSNVTDFSSMFANCGLLKKVIGIEDIDTSSVITMERMFTQSDRLKSIDISGWDTSSLKSIGWMFAACLNLESIDINDWDTSSLEVAEGAFARCTNLKEIDLSKWTTPNLKQMERMFMNCYKLEKADISNFNMTSIKSIYQFFNECRLLINVSMPNKNVSLTNVSYAFDNCNELTTISNIENWNAKTIKFGDYCFNNCKNLVADLRGWDLSDIRSSKRMFYGAKNLKKAKLPK